MGIEPWWAGYDDDNDRYRVSYGRTRSNYKTCPICRGTGTTPSLDRDCSRCNGTGKIKEED